MNFRRRSSKLTDIYSKVLSVHSYHVPQELARYNQLLPPGAFSKHRYVFGFFIFTQDSAPLGQYQSALITPGNVGGSALSFCGKYGYEGFPKPGETFSSVRPLRTLGKAFIIRATFLISCIWKWLDFAIQLLRFA